MNAREREELWFSVGDGRDGEPAIETAAASRHLAGDVKNRGGEHPLYTHAREQEKGREERGVVGDCPGGQTAAGDRQTADTVASNSEGRGEKVGGSRNVRKEGGFMRVCPLFAFYFFYFFSVETNKHLSAR